MRSDIHVLPQGFPRSNQVSQLWWWTNKVELNKFQPWVLWQEGIWRPWVHHWFPGRGNLQNENLVFGWNSLKKEKMIKKRKLPYPPNCQRGWSLTEAYPRARREASSGSEIYWNEFHFAAVVHLLLWFRIRKYFCTIFKSAEILPLKVHFSSVQVVYNAYLCCWHRGCSTVRYSIEVYTSPFSCL